MDASALLDAPLDELCAEARRLRELGHGVLVRTSSKNHFPLAQAKLERYHNGRWVYFGRLVTVR